MTSISVSSTGPIKTVLRRVQSVEAAERQPTRREVELACSHFKAHSRESVKAAVTEALEAGILEWTAGAGRRLQAGVRPWAGLIVDAVRQGARSKTSVQLALGLGGRHQTIWTDHVRPEIERLVGEGLLRASGKTLEIGDGTPPPDLPVNPRSQGARLACPCCGAVLALVPATALPIRGNAPAVPALPEATRPAEPAEPESPEIVEPESLETWLLNECDPTREYHGVGLAAELHAAMVAQLKTGTQQPAVDHYGQPPAVIEAFYERLGEFRLDESGQIVVWDDDEQ